MRERDDDDTRAGLGGIDATGADGAAGAGTGAGEAGAADVDAGPADPRFTRA